MMRVPHGPSSSSPSFLLPHTAARLLIFALNLFFFSLSLLLFARVRVFFFQVRPQSLIRNAPRYGRDGANVLLAPLSSSSVGELYI